MTNCAGTTTTTASRGTRGISAAFVTILSSLGSTGSIDVNSMASSLGRSTSGFCSGIRCCQPAYPSEQSACEAKTRGARCGKSARPVLWGDPGNCVDDEPEGQTVNLTRHPVGPRSATPNVSAMCARACPDCGPRVSRGRPVAQGSISRRLTTWQMADQPKQSRITCRHSADHRTQRFDAKKRVKAS